MANSSENNAIYSGGGTTGGTVGDDLAQHQQRWAKLDDTAKATLSGQLLRIAATPDGTPLTMTPRIRNLLLTALEGLTEDMAGDGRHAAIRQPLPPTR
ncbi:MAG: hypothetical protein O3C60_19740 [Planctomycetota bacterium]|nr:hypothetical protein [Planctomycetota bacterium]